MKAEQKLAFMLFCLCSWCFSKAQLCQGNLSEPVIQIDYGEAGIGGPNYGTALPLGQTTYSYLASNNVQDGQYTIAKNSNLGRPEWHNSADNTPNDNDGYMFIVNADIVVGEFYRARVTGLCESTIFEFAASIMNVLPPTRCGGNGIDPNVRFEIRDIMGNLLATTNSGPIAESPAPVWNKFGLSITTGAGMTAVDVIMLNDAPGGCGNDLAIDDIEFRACGDGATITSTIPDFGICHGDTNSATFTATLDGTVYNSPVFKWQSSIDGGLNWNDIPAALSNTLIVNPLIDGVLYRYRVAESDPNLLNTNCSIVSDSFLVIIHDLPSLTINPPNPLCEGSNISLMPTSDGVIDQTLWTLPNGSIVASATLDFGSIALTDSGNYNVKITDTDGCQSNLDFMLNVQDTSVVTINVARCVGSVYTLPDGSMHTVTTDQPFTHILTKENGCDSTVFTQLTALPTYALDEEVNACIGDEITLPDRSLFTLQGDERFTYNFLTIDNCDSIVVRSYNVLDTTFLMDVACASQSYFLPDDSEIRTTISRRFTFNLPAVTLTCDSVVVLDLQVNPTYRTPVAINECPYEPVTLPQGEKVTVSGSYLEQYVSAAGCDSIVVYNVNLSIDNCNREDLCTIRLPNVFSPNGNTENDKFGPIIPLVCPFERYQFLIFNRWGEQVFATNNPFQKWEGRENGHPANPGLYLYYLDYAIVMEDGSLLSKEESGSVVLMR